MNGEPTPRSAFPPPTGQPLRGPEPTAPAAGGGPSRGRVAAYAAGAAAVAGAVAFAVVMQLPHASSTPASGARASVATAGSGQRVLPPAGGQRGGVGPASGGFQLVPGGRGSISNSHGS